MTFAPTKKTSKSRSKKRTSNWIKLTARKLENRVQLNASKNGLSHFVDDNGMYKGREVIAKKVKTGKTTRI